MSGRDDIIEVASGDQRVGVAPAAGGGLAYWRRRRGSSWLDILRPASPDGLARRDPLALAGFPLVPYSNRIRDGRFTFDGQAIALPPNFGDHAHSIHGHGWRAPWDAVERAPSRVELLYRHSADAWPFDYEARQTIELTRAGLSLTLSLTNLARRPMPAGLGFHPYFAGAPGARLTARIDGVWLTDEEAMPTTHSRVPPRWDMTVGAVVEEMACDNLFTGWNGTALVEWPADGVRLRIEAGDPFRHLVVYAPAGADFFCVEPVSHLTDAFNLAAEGVGDTGMKVLGAGQALTGTVRFRVEPA